MNESRANDDDEEMLEGGDDDGDELDLEDQNSRELRSRSSQKRDSDFIYVSKDRGSRNHKSAAKSSADVMEISDNEMDYQPPAQMRGYNDCQLCSATFVKKAQLDHHVQTKHGTVTKCGVCNKSFRSPTILHIHMVARANPKNRIKCSKCTHRFSKRSEHQKHFEYHLMKAQNPHESDSEIYATIAFKYPKRS